ncbi:hypothetical protein ABZ128_00885 [Streptomyces sp. NPDC006326]|uniref:hypothetical protein n=1 Tax=Streptomyces sp. NPDC006326 TaxID=3156752 RepID=UPI0033B9F43E
MRGHLPPHALVDPVTPGGESPERHLERRLALLHEEAERVTAGLLTREARRQQAHTTCLQEHEGY